MPWELMIYAREFMYMHTDFRDFRDLVHIIYESISSFRSWRGRCVGSAVRVYTVCRPPQLKLWGVSLGYFEFRRFEPSRVGAEHLWPNRDG